MGKSYEQRNHVLILRGRKGKKLFERIKNAPTVPYDRLKAESENFKKKILEKRNLDTNKEDKL